MRSHLFSVVILKNNKSIFGFCNSLHERNTKVIGQIEFFFETYPIFCALKVLSGTAAQLGRVATERHRCMTGKPLTSASRSTDCCRFGACEGHDGSPAETNRPQICSPGPGPVIRAAPDRQQSKRHLLKSIHSESEFLFPLVFFTLPTEN